MFNALPAAPLDGGRLLRAFLWWRTGDRLRATLCATTAGRGLGWVLVPLGLVVRAVPDGAAGLGSGGPPHPIVPGSHLVGQLISRPPPPPGLPAYGMRWPGPVTRMEP